MREKLSLAPLGLIGLPFLPTAYAVGCIFAPLRGYKLGVLLHHVVQNLVLTHTVEAEPTARTDCQRPNIILEVMYLVSGYPI
jgi:hypothetical protein